MVLCFPKGAVSVGYNSMSRTIPSILLCRFVSYLLRLAHDSSLRKLNPDATEAKPASEVVLMNQIERLSSQIMKSKAHGGRGNLVNRGDDDVDDGESVSHGDDGV